ncbi:hypothetical protein CTZ27_03190 [Streptomyces griseocarneus]|nr:hypothetical protein CTZ27_03190 [Streptomyces griseocarneus]
MARDVTSMVWDGSRWAAGTPRVWDGKQWTTTTTVRYFDGDAWRTRPPDPVPYPQHSGAASGLYGAQDYIALPVPAGARVGDLVVSVGASDQRPQLVSPAGRVDQAHQLAMGAWISVVVWPWDGRPDDVVWQVRGASSSTSMNLLYRGGDVSALTPTPVKEFREYGGVNRLLLTPPAGSTSLFVVLVESAELTGYRWPDGLIPRAERLGRFGSMAFSLIAADTPGSGAPAGELLLDATAISTACLTIQIPGSSGDGRPTWILGDDVASVLGTTTILG